MLVLIVAAMLVGASIDAPCETACFKEKITTPLEIRKEANPNDNSWRYSKPYHYTRD